MKQEEKARQKIDEALQASGWLVQDLDQVNLNAARGVAVREFPLKPGHGDADYLLYIDGKAAGVVE
jgi:type I restriction enzyme R subunit